VTGIDSISTPDYIQFDTTNATGTAVAKLGWDDGEGTLVLGLKGGNVNMPLGEMIYQMCYNGTGSTIAKGSVVYISGGQGQRPSVTLARANADATSARTFGVAAEAIANGAEGIVVEYGIVQGIDTSTYSVGQTLYLSSTTAGAFQTTKPVAPEHMVYVANVISVSSTSGRIFVKVQNGYELDEIHDVQITSPAAGSMLIYDATNSLWKDALLTAGSNITITNADGAVTIASTAGASLEGDTDTASPFETSLGYQAGNVNTGVRNSFIGYQAGFANTSGTDNVFVGFKAGDSTTTGYENTAVGSEALQEITTANQNTAMGFWALYSNTATGNTAFGHSAAYSNTTGTDNVAIGRSALNLNTTGAGNTALGVSAGNGNTTGNYNMAIGRSSLLANSTGSNNTGVGYLALATTSVSDNSAIGYQAGRAVSTGQQNTLVGSNAGYSGTNNLTTGTNNIIIGYNAAASAATVSNEITLGNASITSLRIPGLQAGKTTGDVLTFDGSKIVLQTPSGGGGSLLGDTDNATPFETSLGYQAGNANTGVNNSFIGYQAGLANTSGADNTAIGYLALNGNTIGGYNTAIGTLSASSANHYYTVAIGYYSLSNLNGAYQNVGVGTYAGGGLTTGDENTFIGDNAGGLVTTGAYNTLIGSGAGVRLSSGADLTTGSNNIIIGRYATPTTSSVNNQITLGNSSITTLRCQVTTITALSDVRDKTDIQPLAAGLGFINALNPVEFTWNMRDGGKVGEPDTGFIAQDLKAVQEQTGVTIPGLVYEDNPERLEAGYGKLLPVLVKAIQELSAKVAELEAKVK
jgi:hypothetical protein